MQPGADISPFSLLAVKEVALLSPLNDADVEGVCKTRYCVLVGI